MKQEMNNGCPFSEWREIRGLEYSWEEYEHIGELHGYHANYIVESFGEYIEEYKAFCEKNKIQEDYDEEVAEEFIEREAN